MALPLASSPGQAICIVSGPNVTCTGTTNGFGDGTDDFLIITVASGATVNGVSPPAANPTALYIRDNNVIRNNGTLSSPGLFGVGIDMRDDNQVINNGTIIGGANGFAISALLGGAGNTVINNGTIDGRIVMNGGGNQVINSGLLTITNPGTDIGVLHTIAGDYIQTAAGTLELRVNSFLFYDGLLVSGNAFLSGTLRVAVQPGLYEAFTQYTSIITTGCGCVGTFDRVTTTSPFFLATVTLNINGTDLDLNLIRIAFNAVVGLTLNQLAVASALEARYSTALTGNAAIFYGNLLAAASIGVFDFLSGEGTSATQTAAFTAVTMFNSLMMNQAAFFLGGFNPDLAPPISYAPAEPDRDLPAFKSVKTHPPIYEPKFRTWAAGFGAKREQRGELPTGSADLTQNSVGGAAGFEYRINGNRLIGASVGGSSSSFSVPNRATTGDVVGGHLGVYGLEKWGPLYAAGTVSFSHFQSSTTRTIVGVGPTETARAEFDSNLLSGRLELGWRQSIRHVAVTPFAAIEVSRLWQAAYTETSVAAGAPGVLGLNVSARDVWSLPVFLGAQADATAELIYGMTWWSFIRLAWVHEFNPDRGVAAAFISVPAAAFTVQGPRASSDAIKVSAGSKLNLTRAIALFATFEGEFGDLGSIYGATGGAKVTW